MLEKVVKKDQAAALNDAKKMMIKINDIITKAYAKYDEGDHLKEMVNENRESILFCMWILLMAAAAIIALGMAFDINTSLHGFYYITFLSLIIGLLVFVSIYLYTVHRKNQTCRKKGKLNYWQGDELIKQNLERLEMIPSSYWVPLATEYLTKQVCSTEDIKTEIDLSLCRDYINSCIKDPACKKSLEQQLHHLKHIQQQTWFIL